MTTYPPVSTQLGMVRQEIAELSFLLERHENWSRQTDDQNLQKVHRQVATELEKALFEMKKVMTTLETAVQESKE